MGHEHAQKFLGKIPQIKNDLPFSPSLLQKLFVMTGRDSLSPLEEIGEIMSRDQGLSTRVLDVANSAFYGLQSQVSTVTRAVAILGLNEIRNIVVSLGVKGLSRGNPLPKEFDLKKYWKHQIYVAVMARKLADGIEGLNPDNMFTAGLLHDLGKLIVAMYAPDDWRAIFLENAERGGPDIEAEDEYWGLDHGVVGGLVLKSWDLPSELVEPISWHHLPLRAPEFKEETTVLYLADCLAHHLTNEPGPYAQEIQEVCGQLGLDREAILTQGREVLEDETLDHFVRELI